MRILHFKLNFCALVLASLIFQSCAPKTQADLKLGIWKAQLFNKDNIEIPFIFQVKSDKNKKFLIIINAEEQLKVDEVSVVGDSMKIVMPFFDSEFMVFNHGDSLVGRWTKIYADHSVSMPFVAYYDNQNRFNTENNVPNKFVEGTWNSLFTNDDYSDSSYAIGEFKVQNNKVFGTFLSTTGDYRFLEGATDGNKFYMSTFDGSHAYLFSANISADGNKIENGILYSGWSGKQIWSAVRDDNAKLQNADSLTFLKDGYTGIDFTFKNVDGNNVSLNSPTYKNKVVLIQIMGTWCPNCMDETSYLVPFYNEMKSQGLEIIGLCYERSEDFNVASRNVSKMKSRMQIPYELLIPGANKKGFVNESLPMLKNFLAFPTMIIIDKKGMVRKIHTGYSGPATGKHYVEFKSEFESFIKKLLSE